MRAKPEEIMWLAAQVGLAMSGFAISRQAHMDAEKALLTLVDMAKDMAAIEAAGELGLANWREKRGQV